MKLWRSRSHRRGIKLRFSASPWMTLSFNPQKCYTRGYLADSTPLISKWFVQQSSNPSVSAICLKILRYFKALQDCPYAHPYIYPYIRLSDDAAGRWHLTPEGKSVMLLLADQILDKAIRA